VTAFHCINPSPAQLRTSQPPACSSTAKNARLLGSCFLAMSLFIVPLCAAQSALQDEPEANPGRPTVSTPATHTPVSCLQLESGFLAANHSPELSSRYAWNKVLKRTVTHRLESIAADGALEEEN